MVRRLILHIGMHRTGTTSIQESLHGFADDQFVHFKDHRGRRNHGASVNSLLGIGDHGSDNIDSDRARQHFEDTVHSLGDRGLILSGERMWRLSRSAVNQLASYFRDHDFQDIDVVAYIRPPGSYLTSIVSQKIENGRLPVWDIPEAIEREYPSYKRQFENYDAVFGGENVHLWKFDPPSFPSACVVQDFCRRLGIRLPPERIVHLNQSLTREAASLLYSYRKIGAEMGSRSMTGPENLSLVQRLGKIGSKKFRISPELLRPLLEKNRSDIQWMEARLGQSLYEELGEHRPDEIREDGDLLGSDPTAVSGLLEMLGKHAPCGVRGDTPESVALLVDTLRRSNHPSNSAEPRGARDNRRFSLGRINPDDIVKQNGGPDAAKKIDASERSPAEIPTRRNASTQIAEIIEQIQRAVPELASGIPRAEAQVFIQDVFGYINSTLKDTDRKFVSFEGLGRFRVTRAEKTGRENDGLRFSFRPAENE